MGENKLKTKIFQNTATRNSHCYVPRRSVVQLLMKHVRLRLKKVLHITHTHNCTGKCLNRIIPESNQKLYTKVRTISIMIFLNPRSYPL